MGCHASVDRLLASLVKGFVAFYFFVQNECMYMFYLIVCMLFLGFVLYFLPLSVL